MKHKNFILVTFFLTLFVFQQVQAGGTVPPKENPSQISLAPAYAPLPTINVFVLWLTDDNTNAIDYTSWGVPHKCVAPYEHHGCGSIDPTNPQYPQNPAPIPGDLYLQDVLAIEMNIVEIPPASETFQAFKAQAVAARTFASWKAANPGYTLGSEGGFGHINNSTDYQAFIPGYYNDSQVANKSLILDAISETQGQYLSYFPDGTNPDGTRKTIDAEFGSDFKDQSADDPSKDYLNIVQDPISATCDVPSTPNYGGLGMSQKGAMRWAKGDQCADPTKGNSSWPVKWSDYRQILAHYYIGIDIMGPSGKVAPDDRWNLLKHGVPSQMTSGITQSVEIWLQNTSTTEWTDAVLGYQWVGTNIPWTEINLPVMPAGKDEKIQVDIIPPSANGTYTLRLDVKHANSSWFSQAGWPDVRIAVTVTGAIATPTPMPIVCTSWNLASDFRIAPNQENPNRDSCNNPGVWEFMTGTGLTRDPLNYSLASYFTPSFQGAVDVNAWSGNSSLSWPFIAYNASSQVQLGLWPPHTINVHPQDNQLAIIAWKSTLNGYVSISGGVVDTDPRCGSGIQWFIDKNSSNLASGSYSNGGSQSFASGTNGINLNTAAVNMNDMLYLIIDPNGDDYCDTTQVNLSIITGSPILTTPTPLNGPTPTDFPPNFTPPPSTATSIPQPTPTPEPCWCPLITLFGIPCNGSASSGAAPEVFRAGFSIQDTAFDIQLFYRVRDEVLSQTTEGQRYIDLYNVHGLEISRLLLANPSLKDEAIATLQLWEPNLQALVDGGGSNVTITSGQAQTVQTFLDHLYALASPELQQTITEERARRPLERTVDMTMGEAWSYTNGYQLEWLPPISNSNPYSAQQESTIPVKFTVTDFEGNFVIDQTLTLQVLDSNGNVVIGPVQVSDNTNNDLKIQGNQYHYNLQTKDLPAGSYILQVAYNSSNGAQSETRSIILTRRK